MLLSSWQERSRDCIVWKTLSNKEKPRSDPRFRFYKNTYFSTNSTAKMYMSGATFLALPVTVLSTTYEMTPNQIPSEML